MTKQDNDEIVLCPKCGHDRMQSGLMRARTLLTGKLVLDGTEEFMLQCVGCHYVFELTEYKRNLSHTEELIE